MQFLNGLSRLDLIEYVEEPFKNFSDTFAFQKLSDVPLAIDESIVNLGEDLTSFDNCYFVLKPSLIGLSSCFELMNRFSPRTIISSSYERPSALRPFFFLAALNPVQFHGLDTLKYLPKKFSIKSSSFLLTF